MNKSVIIILLCFAEFVSYAQVSTIMKNREIIMNFPDSMVKLSILIEKKEQKCHGEKTYYWYSSNKIHQNKGGYSGSLLDGKYQVYLVNKNMISQGFFRLGLKNGDWTYWNPEGKTVRTETWKKGELTAIKNYSGDEMLIEHLTFENGVLDGKCYYWQKDTCIIKKYRNGKICEGKTGLFREKKKKTKEKDDPVSGNNKGEKKKKVKEKRSSKNNESVDEGKK